MTGIIYIFFLSYVKIKGMGEKIIKNLKNESKTKEKTIKPENKKVIYLLV